MKFIVFAAVISMMSFNTLAQGENPDQGCHYCTPCKKVVCQGNLVDAQRGASLKRDVSSSKTKSSKKATVRNE